jgi:glycosyltransferase involved in cell wall biosynthesis
MHRWLLDCVRSQRIDAIHIHGMWRMTSVIPCWVGSSHDVPVVLAPRGTLSEEAMRVDAAKKRLFWHLLQRGALRKVSCFHATGEPEAEHIRRLGFRQPIAVIPNGIDVPERFDRSRQAARTVLYLGRIHRIKGLDTLLQAWSAVEPRRTDWTLRIVGPDNEGHLGELKALAQALGLKHVAFEKPADGDARLTTYSEAAVYVLPSRSENFGMTVAEALAAGTPALVSRGAPWSAVVRERCGWWIDCTAASLAETLLSITLMPPSELEAMGDRGRLWMDREFGWKPIAERMALLYQWLQAGMPGATRPPWRLR